SPASNASNVDLPALDAPTMARVSPAAMLRSTALRMVSVPSGLLTCLLMLSALRTGCAMLISGSGPESVISGNMPAHAHAAGARRAPTRRWMTTLAWLMAAWVIGLCRPGLVQAATDEAVILVLGDSLSAGYGMSVEATWVALLQQRLRTEDYGYRVVNASISGETTTGAL